MASSAIPHLLPADFLTAPLADDCDLGQLEPCHDAASFAARLQASEFDAALTDADLAAGALDGWRDLPNASTRGWVVIGGTEPPPQPRCRWVSRDGDNLVGRTLAALEEVQIEAALESMAEMGGPEFVVEMLDLVAKQAPEQLAAIQAGVAASDWSQVHKTAHSLKGGSSNFGIRAVQRLALRIEKQAATGDGTGLAELAAALERAWARAGGVLAAQRGRYAV